MHDTLRTTSPEATHEQQRRQHARYILWMLTAMSAISFMDRQVLAVLIPQVKLEFAMSDLQVGIVTGFGFALTFCVLGIPLGRIADRTNRRNLIAICRSLGGTITMLGAAAGGFWQLALTRSGGALNDAGGGPASMSLIADLYEPHQRSGAISIFGLGGSIGSLLALVGGGWLAQQFGWRTTLASIGAGSLLLALLFRLFTQEPARSGSGGVVAPAMEAVGQNAVRQIWRNPVARALILAAAFILIAAYAFGAWNFTYLVRYHHMSLAQAGLVSGGAAIGSIAGGLLAGALADRLTRRNVRWQIGVPLLGTSCALPLGLVYFLVPPGETVLLGCLIAGFAFFIAWWVAPTYAALSFVVASNRRATANAMLLLAGSVLGSGVSPVLTGWMSDLLAPLAGGNSLRYAMTITMCLLSLAVVALVAALRAYPAALAQMKVD